ncbi:MAG: hypothetical protein QOK29_2234 [Rhodospirillaceae bacterium]|nr:hypothetical protein [Rhodospirillaceae bacterium]
MTTSFTVNKADLEFILKQIKIAEATSVGYTPAVAPVSILQAIMDAYGLSAADAAIAPYGLRTVDGRFNSLLPGQSDFGAADTLFPRLTTPVYRNETDGDSIDFDGPGGQPPVVQGNYGQPGTVVDADPRIISNLIVDMSVNNPAALDAFFANPLSLEAFEAAHPGFTPVRPGELTDPTTELEVTNTDLHTIPNQSPDIGLSPGFNAWMTFFGQFFDHGLDLVTKGDNGTVYVPLQPDDPLIAGADGVLGDDPTTVGVDESLDDLPAHLQFMALTRATPTMVDPDGAGPLPETPQHENTTTSFVDQNQTYTSHPSHQVFLREYVKVDIDGPAGNGPVAVSTGKMLDGTALAGAIGNWAEVKAQAQEMLGLILTDFDVHDVPLLATDQYGKFIPGANGYAQLVMPPDGVTHLTNWLLEGTAGGLAIPAEALRTGHAFLNDIAHHATPGRWDSNGDHVITAADAFQVVDADPGTTDDGLANTYDDEMLNSHFATGDGRGNENIALTTVHSIFHSEHNRLVEVNKLTIAAEAATDPAFVKSWLLNGDTANMADQSTWVWDGERLFQAARFGTEMQYQHLVFEEFARRVQPMVDPFIFNSNPEIDPSIVAEFAHTVYRFGHSMLTGTVDRLDNNLNLLNGELDQKTLLAVFLNPQAYVGSGADLATINANLIRGLSRDVGNAIDEFIVSDVRSNLLGLPLDLAVLNISRGRETGIPSLNQTREQLYNDSGLADLKPYESWFDFALNIKNVTSIVNFIAAYGTHPTITGVTTLADKRAAAELLVFGGAGEPSDRLDFLHATGAYAPDGSGPNDDSRGGLDLVDLWIGGLAEKSPEFGGMLGTTFNFVFEAQMENLQFGDRLYYLTRTQGTNFLNNLEPNSFADLVMRNTALGDIYSTHLNGQLFVTPDYIIELDRGIAQTDYNPNDLAGKDPDDLAGKDPVWGAPSPILGPKVQRDYTGSTVVDGTHDFGGTLRALGGEHYVLGGTEGNDRIYGDSGIDTLWGDGGDDYLNGGTESDDVFGGEGDDIIEDPFGDDVLRGNQGNDVVTSARGADLLFGDAGTDYIVLGQDAGEVFGGLGADFILGGAGKDFLLGNEGDDWIEGAAGFDTIAGDNSELFFNSPIIGHDVLFGQGDETDYDAESGDDIMTSGPSVFRYEGMFGFDWGIAKGDLAGVKFDLQIPIFTTIPADVLRDRFDQVEALSGWTYNDVLDGDDRGHKGGGSSAPDSVPTELFTDHILTQEGINRIDGMQEWFGGALTTFGLGTSFRDGNILMGGAGGDFLRGRGGYDILDGDAWLNVRIDINIGGTHYSAESMNTDTTVAGQYAGKVFNTNPDGSPNFNSPAFGGRSLTSLLLDRTINPGQMSIVREILNSDGTQVSDVSSRNNAGDIDTAVFQGTLEEYDIEGRGAIVGGVEQRAFDLNGDGFISVHDRDTGLIGATVIRDGADVVLASRGALTDDTDLLRNVEQLQFADETIAIGGSNTVATGIVTISDPTLFDHDNNPATPPMVTPIVGQVLTATLSNLQDADGVPLDANNMPVGLTFEWQTTEIGSNAGWTAITTGLTYTVRPVDPGHILRAVAVFKDSAGVTERIASVPTDGPTVPFSVLENSPTNTIVSAAIPFSPDYDPQTTPGGPTDGDIVTLTHVLAPGGDAGGRFKIVNVGGVDQLQVASGSLIDYEADADHQYQIVIESYTDTIANGGLLLASRQFTVLIGDVDPEIVPSIPLTDINWNGVRPGESVLPGSLEVIANLSTVDPDASPVVYSNIGADASFVVTAGGAVSRTGGLAQNTTYVLNVKAQETALGGASITEAFNIRTGTDAANTISGSALTDIIYGDDGNDTLNGLAGNDTLFGQDEVDTLNGGAGDDDLTGGDDNDIINGGAGSDTIRYTIGDDQDTVNGGDNNDTLVITGTAGAETLDVTFNGTRITQIEGGGSIINVESVTADLLGNTDELDYDGTTANVTVDLTLGTASGFTSIAGIENVTGDAGNDTLIGKAGVINVLSGGAGNDTFTVHDIGDVVSEAAGGGTDTVQSLATLFTISDADVENLTLLGTADINGTGNASANVITGNSGNNVLNGGNGVDTASYLSALIGVSASLSILIQQDTLGAGKDTLSNFENLTGSNQGDTLTGNTAANVLSGALGSDTLIATVDNARDTLDGGGGTDTANYGAYAAALVANLGGAAPIIVIGSGSNAANSDVLASIENFIGGSGGDTLSGSGAANALSGGGGNDILAGNGGADILSGGANNDTFIYNIGDGADAVDGGSETDTLNIVGGAGGETLDVIWNGSAIANFEGGSVVNVEAITANLNGGTDTLSYAGSTSGATVNLGTSTASGFTTIAGIENVTGTAQADTLTGGAAANTLSGGGGIDNLNGGAGGDILIGGDGQDTINTGAADDNVADIVRFTAVTEFGDTVSNFDANGTVDRVEFGGALNTAWDDGNSNDNFLFATGNGIGTTVNATVGQSNGDIEALLLTGAGSEGVTNANLGNAAAVAAAFNLEFNITAANGEDALLAINDTDANSFALWQWIQAGGGEITDTELTLVGIFQANATATAASFDFV